MMKKKLLFVMPGLDAGGGEKSLVNLLGQIDFTQYEVDLFLFTHKGLFVDYVPKEVNLLPLPENYRLFVLPYYQALTKLIAKGKFSLACNRLLYSITNKKYKNSSVREQYSWRFLSKSLEKMGSHYDAVIGFLEKTSVYYCVDKVAGARKIGWIHIDYDKLGMDPRFDFPYFQQLDSIVTVSKECANILKNRFPSESNKVKVIHNIISPSVIKQLADQGDDVFSRQGDEVVILSIGRLHHQKGFELAIEACRLLVDQGCNVRWNIIGEGEERGNLENLIAKHGVTQHVKLLGQRANPYPYIRQADIYVQPSKFEGKSIAIDEAKILNKPIVVTNYSTAKDQIRDGVDGIIVEMNAASLASGICKLIREPLLRKDLAENLSLQHFGTEREIAKLYQLIL